MSQQVRQAFPEVPVVLNLAAGRQQLAARQSARRPDRPALRQPVATGGSTCRSWWAVDSLTFEQGRLQLSCSPTLRRAGGQGRRQAALAQAGVAAEHDGHTWHPSARQVAEKAQASDRQRSAVTRPRPGILAGWPCEKHLLIGAGLVLAGLLTWLGAGAAWLKRSTTGRSKPQVARPGRGLAGAVAGCRAPAPADETALRQALDSAGL
jgi:hypothetical protein